VSTTVAAIGKLHARTTVRSDPVAVGCRRHGRILGLEANPRRLHRRLHRYRRTSPPPPAPRPVRNHCVTARPFAETYIAGVVVGSVTSGIYSHSQVLTIANHRKLSCITASGSAAIQRSDAVQGRHCQRLSRTNRVRSASKKHVSSAIASCRRP